MADSVRRKPAQPHAKSEAWLRGPRSLCLKRSEYGFGFTLRHFIVYPPESFSVWEGLGSPRTVDPAQPMDTIFVKQVHADSPASEAGLSTGDRIVGVNGHNVAGFPYSQVVQLIQHSEAFLRLAVVPRERDLLQLYFGATAHNPETNQRPRLRSPDKQASALPVPVHRIHSAPHRQLDNTTHLAKAIKQRQSLDNAPVKPRLSLAGPTPRYRHPQGRRASEGNNALKRDAIYDNGRLTWDEGAPHREEMVVNRGGGGTRPVGRTAGTPTDSDMSDSSNSLYYQSGSSLDAGRRQSTELTDSKDSLSSFDSTTSTLTGQDQSSDDSLIMSRIRKSFEQKEEFLRRPNQPIVYNLGPEHVAAVPPIREFYARPQKLQKAVWPPNNPVPRTGSPARTGDKPANRNLRRVRSELDSDRDSSRSNDRTSPDPNELQPRGQFVYGGQVTNVPNSNLNQLAQDAFRPPPNSTNPAGVPHRQQQQQQRHFVTTLARIHENLPDSSPSPSHSDEAPSPPSDQYARSLSSPSDQYARALSSPTDNRYGPHTERVQIVSRRARQFETGQLEEEEDRTDFYRSELARLSAKRSVPTVALRTKEFESRGDQADRRGHRESRSLEGTGPAIPYGSGNRVVLIGTKNLHCEPPADFRPETRDAALPSCLRARSNSAESWAAALGTPRNVRGTLDWPLDRKDSDEPARHKAVRQDSYLAACRTPVNTEPRASRLLKRQGTSLDESSEDVPPPSSRPNQEGEEGRVPPATRPTQLTLVARGDGEGEVVAHTDVESLITALDNATAQGLLSADAAIPIVIRRQKNVNHHTTLDDDRLRRASYLKATCGERMHVDSDLEYSDTEQQLRSANRKWRPPLFPDDIQQLREIFEEGARPIPSRQYTRDHPTQLATPAQENKENLPATREGWLHCKVTVIDGKRAGDRSWKQVWAVLTDHTLTLYKDRRDPQQTSGQTPSAMVGGGESESVDMCCAQVDKAGDYTKRKHVLRLNTLSCSELLLQAADNEDMTGWLAILGQAAREDCASLKSPPGSARLSPLPNKGIRKLTSFRTRSPTGQSPVSKTLKPSHPAGANVSADQPAGSPKSKTWKGRVARQFRRIQHGANSPSSPTVESRDAYPEGSTVGIPLEHCPMAAENEFVPFLVAKCAAIVEERGLDIIGIYRVPGNTAAISSLTEAVNKGFQFNNFQDPRWSDVNVISSLLKLFFRKLPDALLTSELYPLFIDADKMDDPNNRITALRKLIHELPDHHFETLKFLLTHLKRVVNQSSVNKMEARNLAIVFGPTLVRTADNNMVTMVTDMSHQCRIVESLLLYSDWFFSEEDEPTTFPFGLSNEVTAELEAAAINHNQSLLLSNIQKVEGMKSDSTGKDILAKVIGSSIISAANRKIQKTRTRRSEENREDNERRRREAAVGAGAVAAVIAGTGGGVEGRQAGGGSQQEALMEEAPRPTEAETRQQQQRRVPLDYEDGTIRTYAGLSATTQERIRRFEQETKAMLQRDLTRQRDSQQQQQQQQQPGRRDADKMADSSSDPPKKTADPVATPASQSPDVRTVSTFTRKSSSSSSSTTETTATTTNSPGKSPAASKPPDVQATRLPSPRAKAATTSHIHLNPIADNRTESTVHRIGKKHLFSGSLDGDDSVITHSTVDSLAPFYGDTITSQREVSRVTKKHVCDGSSSDETGVRRGSSVENVAALAVETAQPTHKTANGTLKRFKTGREQLAQPSQLMSSLRCGSLDSLQEVFGSDRPPSEISDDGSDLLSSLTSTFDRKLKSLLNNAATPPPVSTVAAAEGSVVTPPSPARSRIPTYRDPSLHRRASLTRPQTMQEPASAPSPSVDRQAIRRQWLELGGGGDEPAPPAVVEAPPEPPKRDAVGLKRSESLKKSDRSDPVVRLRRAASLTKADRPVTRSDSLTKADRPVARSDSLTNRPVTRSDSLTKTEKTESNLSMRRRSEMSTKLKLKRKNGMPERAIKRRHTVGGTRDFDKLAWLTDNRLTEERDREAAGRRKLRTSSPDLGGGNTRPRSLADAVVALSGPLESHV